MKQDGKRVVGLGIDAGGTYTDAVLFDLRARQVLAKAKSLTTYHEFAVGIRGALEQLPPDVLRTAVVTALSTTLATNAVVEGRGQHVGLIMLSPWQWLLDDTAVEPCVRVPGNVNCTGQVTEPLDEAACRRAVLQLVAAGCSALAVAAYGAQRNPEQVYRVRDIAREVGRVPVVCAHEISRRLDTVQGARTAVANARLLPVVAHLLDSVRDALNGFGVGGPLMVVKGDGTPVDESVARLRPVETILSGPAASVSGARALTGLGSALVMDVGGTTTDCAILEDGHVAVAPDGARVGGWTVGVDVADICTVGLGGDSRLGFQEGGALTVGPERSVPLCCVASQHPPIAAWLKSFDRRRWRLSRDATPLDVLLTGGPCSLNLSRGEAELLSLVQRGPVPIIRAASQLGLRTWGLLPLERLEQCGAVKRASLTPTDLMHVTGEFEAWDARAAADALDVFASLWGRATDQVLAEARAAVTRRVFEEALRRESLHADPRFERIPEEWGFLLDRADGALDTGPRVAFGLRRPIIAIGAPAPVLVPPVRRLLDADVVVPPHADVANAIGAIATEITVREEALVRPNFTPEGADGYFVHTASEMARFASLDEATRYARDSIRTRASEAAAAAGARQPRVTLVERDGSGTAAEGSIFLERAITAIAMGPAFDGG